MGTRTNSPDADRRNEKPRITQAFDGTVAKTFNIHQVFARHYFSERGFVLVKVERTAQFDPDYIAFPKRGEDQAAVVWLNRCLDEREAVRICKVINLRPLLFKWWGSTKGYGTQLITIEE
jgi:hypothetical protein